MFDATLGKFARQVLALFNANSSDKNWLTLCVSPSNIFNNSAKFRIFRLENEVRFIFAHNITVGWNWHNIQIVGVYQFSCFCLCSSSHACKLVVHAEVVLQSNGCKSLVLFVDAHAFFCFNSLVNAFAPTTALQNTACEFIDDLYVATINDVILVASV